MTYLDWHTVKAFFIRYGLTLVTIVGLYVMVDAIERLPAISKQPRLLDILRVGLNYYLSHTPIFLFDFAPGFSLIAGIWTLTGILNRNELIAMQSSGISSRRALLGLILVSGIPSVLYGVAQNQWGHHGLHLYQTSEYEVRKRNLLAEIHDVIIEDKEGRVFLLDSYDPQSRTLTGIWMLPSSKNESRLSALNGVFKPNGLLELVNVRKWEIDLNDDSKIKSVFVPKCLIKTNLSEEILTRNGQIPQFMDRQTLLSKAEALKGWPEAKSLRMEYYRRITDVFSSIGLILASIPLVVALSYRARGMSIAWWLVILMERMLPILVFALFYGTKLIAESFLVEPLTAAWSPTLFIFCIGIGIYRYADY